MRIQFFSPIEYNGLEVVKRNLFSCINICLVGKRLLILMEWLFEKRLNMVSAKIRQVLGK